MIFGRVGEDMEENIFSPKSNLKGGILDEYLFLVWEIYLRSLKKDK
jgi:hypothetical protein